MIPQCPNCGQDGVRIRPGLYECRTDDCPRSTFRATLSKLVNLGVGIKKDCREYHRMRSLVSSIIMSKAPERVLKNLLKRATRNGMKLAEKAALTVEFNPKHYQSNARTKMLMGRNLAVDAIVTVRKGLK